MASLRVPERHKEGLTKLLNLSAEDTQKVISALEGIPITGTLPETLAERFLTLEAFPQEDIPEAADTLTALYTVLAYSNEPPSDVAEDIAEALVESGIELKFPDGIQERLIQLLSFDPLVVSAKAGGLMYEYENTFSTARVISDVRPVFGLNAEELPKAGIITHILNIHYFHSGQHKEFNMSLDEYDIGFLIEALERASSKTESLKSLLETAKLTYIEP